MTGIKQSIIAAAAAALIACAPVGSAAAGGHGFGRAHPWGIGRGLVGAVVALATLPVAIVAAVVSAGEQAAPSPPPAYGDGGGYASPASYPAPPVYYAPRPAYYPQATYYYPAPRANVARPYYAPRPAYRAGYGYRSGGYAYPRR
jgi:hypothetical protein